MSEWVEIPDHLLELIAEKMTDFEDILTFGLICKQWRAVAMISKETFMKKQTQQLPWLMLPPRRGSHLRGFYNLTRRRIHQIPSWESNGKKCYSSKGWLLTVGSDWGMNLLHPMTLARFKLPVIHEWLNKPHARFISRVILSANPSLTTDFVLMALQGCPPMPAYWRPGDKEWTLIKTMKGAFADAVFYQDKCYFINLWRELWVTDFGICNPTTAKFITKFTDDLIQKNFFESLYLVILEGSLLLVSKVGSQFFSPKKEFKERPYHAINFQVFKLDFKSLSSKELKSLGNWSFFVGDNSSMALNTSVVKGCKPNSIYFTDESTDIYGDSLKRVGFAMGIFNMTDRTTEPLIEGSWRNRLSTPMFVDSTF